MQTILAIALFITGLEICFAESSDQTSDDFEFVSDINSLALFDERCLIETLDF